MSVAKMWADAQANAQKILGKDGKLPKMPADLDKLADDYNKSLDDIRPCIQSIGDAWSKAKDKADDISKCCDSISKAVQGDDFGLDFKDPNQAKKHKTALAVLTNALTSIKGTTVSNKQKNVTWVTKQVQAVLK